MSDSDEASSSTAFQHFLARCLGYLIGFGSLMLYTPIAIRVCRQKHADGLVMSTWWLKVFSYLLSDIYYIRKQYELSTYAETVVITVEAIVVLSLVAFYQHRTNETSFRVCLGALLAGSIYGFFFAPAALLPIGQLVATIINLAALFPQFYHNFSIKTKGDYSPLTCGLAVVGCTIRVFTTVTLNESDPVLMVTFLAAIMINGALLLQIVFYGMVVEGLTLVQVVLSDVVTVHACNDDVSGGVSRDGAYGGIFNGDARDEELREIS